MALSPGVAAVLGGISGVVFAGLVLCLFVFAVKPYLDRRGKNKRRESVPSITFSREVEVPHAVPVKVQPKGFFSFMKKKRDDPPSENDFKLSSSGVVYPVGSPEVRKGSVKIMPLSPLKGDDEGGNEVDPEVIKMSCLLAPQFRVLSEGMDIVSYDEDIFASGDTDTVQDCQMEFTLYYDLDTRELHITVLRLTGMPVPRGPFRRYPNSCVKIRIIPNPELHWQRTREVKGTLDPAFNETFVIPGFAHNKLREYTVHFVVLDYDEFLNNVTIVGEVNHPLADLRAKRLLKVTRRVARSYR